MYVTSKESQTRLLPWEDGRGGEAIGYGREVHTNIQTLGRSSSDGVLAGRGS
jgi:hypothetical protein